MTLPTCLDSSYSSASQTVEELNSQYGTLRRMALCFLYTFLLLGTFYMRLVAWNCTINCSCNGLSSTCCHPHPALIFPITGHPNTTVLLLDSCSHFRLNRETLQNFAALEKISIKRTYIAYIDSDAFHHIPNLRTLILEENNLSNTAIHHNAFHKLHITVLSLRNNRLVRIGHQTFSGLINLQHLDLFGNNIAVIEDSSFTALVNLQFLNLDNNSLSTITSLWFSGASLNNTNLKISLLANNLTCECRYRGIDLPEYAWFKRSLILPNNSCLLYNTKEECKPPKLEEFYQVIHGIALQPLDLHCPVTGFPFPKIMWILPNGLQISNRSFPPFYNIDGTLTIQLVHSSFGGLYACMATNIEGTEIGLYNLVISFSSTKKPLSKTKTPIIFPTPSTIIVSKKLWVILWLSIAIICVIFSIALFWSCRCIFKYIRQHIHGGFTFSRFVDTPNTLTVPENPHPTPDVEGRHLQMMHGLRDIGEDTQPSLPVQSSGSNQQPVLSVTETETRM